MSVLSLILSSLLVCFIVFFFVVTHGYNYITEINVQGIKPYNLMHKSAQNSLDSSFNSFCQL